MTRRMIVTVMLAIAHLLMTEKQPKESRTLRATMRTKQRILQDKIIRGKRHFRIKWEKFSGKENSWEPEDNVPGVLIQEYFRVKSERKRQRRRRHWSISHKSTSKVPTKILFCHAGLEFGLVTRILNLYEFIEQEVTSLVVKLWQSSRLILSEIEY